MRLLDLEQPPKDIETKRHLFQKAKDIWYQDWIKQGSTDEGSCCGGKGISIWYVGKRERSAKPANVVSCSWVQGNISASKSVKGALAFLKSHNIDCTYNDGWMD